MMKPIGLGSFALLVLGGCSDGHGEAEVHRRTDDSNAVGARDLVSTDVQVARNQSNDRREVTVRFDSDVWTYLSIDACTRFAENEVLDVVAATPACGVRVLYSERQEPRRFEYQWVADTASLTVEADGDEAALRLEAGMKPIGIGGSTGTFHLSAVVELSELEGRVDDD